MSTADQVTPVHAPRLDVAAHAGAPYAALARVEERIALDPGLRELIRLRASQVNACAFCLDMHWAQARAAGESDVRLAQLAAHAESPWVALETLTPVERAAFVLHEVFDYDYGRIAEIVDRTEVNARQLVARAKRHVAAGRPRSDPDDAARDRLFRSFLTAVDAGELGALEELLAEDVVLWSDGGGRVTAARIPVEGAEKVARFLVHTARRRNALPGVASRLVRVNGQPGLLVRQADGGVWSVLAADVVDGRIETLRIVRNPEKLGHLVGADPAAPEA